MSMAARERLLGWILSLPTLLIVAATYLFPLIFSAWLSVHQVGLKITADAPFVGFQHYLTFLTSGQSLAAIGHTLYFMTISLLVQIPLGILVALILNQPFRGRNLVRALILIPWAIPTIVNGIMWQWILNASYGALNGVLYQFGLISAPVAWLGDPLLAMNMVILADTWKVLPFYVLLFLAALQTIPPELYDSASVDGANGWNRFWHIVYPFLRATLLVVLVVRTMETFRVFDIVYMLTSGGPAGGTTVVAYYAYQATFNSLKFGYGSAISFIIGGIILALALVYIRLLRTEDLY